MMIMYPILNVPRTINEWTTLGKISRRIMALFLKPDALAASTYSFVASDRTSPRINLKNSTQPLKVRAKIKFQNPGPIMAMTPIAKIKKGKASRISANREINSSNNPL
jgi:hypothetical protein